MPDPGLFRRHHQVLALARAVVVCHLAVVHRGAAVPVPHHLAVLQRQFAAQALRSAEITAERIGVTELALLHVEHGHIGQRADAQVTELGVAAKAFLFAWHIDSIAAAGLIMDDVWNERRVITIDLLGDEFLEAVKTGDPIAIKEDGTVEVG